jgi:hypothetical protein
MEARVYPERCAGLESAAMLNALLVSASALAQAAAAPAQTAPLARETLENGFEILSLADPILGAKVFGTLYVRGGRLDEPLGQEGAADLVAATWIAGGSTASDGQTLRAWLAAHDAALEIGAEADHWSIDFHCAPAELAELYARLAELVVAPAFPNAEFQSAREELADAARDDEDEAEPFRVLERLALSNAVRAGRRASRASVLSIDREELVAFHARSFAADRMLLGLCGAIDGATLDATRVFAAALPVDGAHAVDPETSLDVPARTTVFLGAAPEARLWIVSRAPNRGEADFALLDWALRGARYAPRDDPAAERAAGVLSGEALGTVAVSDWRYASLRVGAAIDPTRGRDALARLASRFAPPRIGALLEPARTSERALQAAAPEPPSARRTIEHALLASIRPGLDTKLALAPTPDDLAAAATRWFDPGRVWVLAEGPIDVLERAFGADCDLYVLDHSRTVASTRAGLAKRDALFAALGGHERWAKLTSLATEGEVVLKNGEVVHTRQVRDVAGARLWQEQTRASGTDVTVLDPTGVTTFHGATAQTQPGPMHARLVRRSACHLYQLLHDLALEDERAVRVADDGALEVLAPDGLLCWLELDAASKPKRLGWPADTSGPGGVFVYTDWKEFAGFPYPATIEQPEAGVRTTTAKLEIGVALDEALFRRLR